jgi:hypothetical protein
MLSRNVDRWFDRDCQSIKWMHLMLFLPESVYEARAKLLDEMVSEKITREKAYSEMVALDPYDFVGLIGLGRLREETGDFAAAEEYYWRALRAHPCVSAAYHALARSAKGKGEPEDVTKAFVQLAIGKNGLDIETFDKLNPGGNGILAELIGKIREMPDIERARLIAEAMMSDLKDEPESVTELMRPLRLLDSLQKEPMLEPATVDAILAEGAAMVPLLVGVLRDWAQNPPGEDDDDDTARAENAMGLVGELGTAEELPAVLELIEVEDADIAGCAEWALGRIFQRHPAESGRFVGANAAEMTLAERLAVSTQIVRCRAVDPNGELLEALVGGISDWKKSERNVLVPIVLSAMIAARGPAGVAQARAALERNRRLLSPDARSLCEGLVLQLDNDNPLARPEPSTITVYDICAGEAVWDDEEDDDEELEDDYLPPPEPIRRAVMPGRNDPCWCNSGKKYKKCHLESDERERQGGRPEIAARGAVKDFTGLRQRIGEFMRRMVPGREMRRAREEFFDTEFRNDIETDEATVDLLIGDWVVHDRLLPVRGTTVLEEFLKREGDRLAPHERQLAESWTRTFVGFYEVQEVTPGKGVELKEMVTGEKFFAHDVSLSRRMVRWDGLLARVLEGERGIEVTGTGLTVPRRQMAPLFEWMKEDRRNSGLEWPEYMRKNWPRVRSKSLEMSSNWMENVSLSNTHGEEVLFSKAVFEIKPGAEGTIAAAFASGAEFQSDTDDDPPKSFVWMKPGDEERTVLGHVRIDDGRIVLECNSRERLERGKNLMEGMLLRHLRDEFTTQKEVMSRASSGTTAPATRPELPEDAHKMVAQYIEDHYRKWLDMRIPALGGKTPREASGTADGREQLRELLKEVENGEERKRQRGDAFYDVSRLRAELNMD